ncbi:hypothetical protein [Acaryochloris sp. IP29b_bin.148]|uniref:hypothetical protein n=1 Tax=Acaryochloris sp. IP29b_bin.148 TaxID=2969218 RepID=UPI00261F9F15|nr:hypothetical protein [Acaryochloris sp. IP29b_bin.148]
MLANLALHTAARHYCQTQSNYWYQHTTEIRQTIPRDQGNYQQMLLESYARSDVLTIICIELERLDPDHLDDIDTTRDLIVQIGRSAQKMPPHPNMGQPPPQISQATFGVNVDDAMVSDRPSAIADEREAFCTYIQALSESQLQAVQPLPYQRVLSLTESKTLWQGLRNRWQIIGPYWHPLHPRSLPDITAFNTEAFEAFCDSFSLIDQLSTRGITRIWELRDYGIEYEQDISLFDPAYNGNEGYWTSNRLDWIVYASHEDSTTIGGWLLEEIKVQWPDWEKHTW